MKRLKALLILPMLILAISFVLVSCGKNDSDGDTNDNTKGTTYLTYVQFTNEIKTDITGWTNSDALFSDSLFDEWTNKKIISNSRSENAWFTGTNLYPYNYEAVDTIYASRNNDVIVSNHTSQQVYTNGGRQDEYGESYTYYTNSSGIKYFYVEKMFSNVNSPRYYAHWEGYDYCDFTDIDDMIGLIAYIFSEDLVKSIINVQEPNGSTITLKVDMEKLFVLLSYAPEYVEEVMDYSTEAGFEIGYTLVLRFDSSGGCVALTLSSTEVRRELFLNTPTQYFHQSNELVLERINTTVNTPTWFDEANYIADDTLNQSVTGTYTFSKDNMFSIWANLPELDLYGSDNELTVADIIQFGFFDMNSLELKADKTGTVTTTNSTIIAITWNVLMGGALIITTPNGVTGFFHRNYVGYEIRSSISWDDNYVVVTYMKS